MMLFPNTAQDVRQRLHECYGFAPDGKYIKFITAQDAESDNILITYLDVFAGITNTSVLTDNFNFNTYATGYVFYEDLGDVGQGCYLSRIPRRETRQGIYVNNLSKDKYSRVSLSNESILNRPETARLFAGKTSYHVDYFLDKAVNYEGSANTLFPLSRNFALLRSSDSVFLEVIYRGALKVGILTANNKIEIPSKLIYLKDVAARDKLPVA